MSRFGSLTSLAASSAASIRLLAVGSSIMGALIGCGRGTPAVSGVQHEPDQPTRGTDQWMWADVTADEYETATGPLLGGLPAVMDPANPLVRRFQFWVDRIDASVRANDPDKLAYVAKPRVRVLPDGTPNAFIAPTPTCYDVPVTLDGGSGSSTASAVLLSSEGGAYALWPDELACVKAKNPVAVLTAFAKRYNQNTGTCRVSVSGGRLALGAGCENDGSVPANVGRATRLVLLEAANVINIHSGIVSIMEEGDMVAVLAHEMGHYYRAHATIQPGEYDFFYTMTETPVSGRPVAVPELAELGDKAKAASSLLTATDLFATVAGQTLRSDLLPAVGSFVKQHCRSGQCAPACQKTASLMGDTSFILGLGRFPLAPVTGEQGAFARSFEQNALACLKTVDAERNWTRFQSALQSPTWPAWVNTLSERSKESWDKTQLLSAARLAVYEAPAGATLADAVAGASALLTAQDDEGESILKEAYTSHLGQYTIEQEADDFSIEVLADLGLDPRLGVRAMSNLHKGAKDELRGLSVGFDRCDTMEKNRWYDAEAGYMFVPVGDYSEIHHNTCFRMFNMDREIAAHAYLTPAGGAPRATPPALLSPSAWSDLQAAALAMAPQLPTRRGGALNWHQLLRKVPTLTQCSYAAAE